MNPQLPTPDHEPQTTRPQPPPTIHQPFFGPRARFHHVGLAVESIRAIHPDLDPIVELRQGVALAFITVGGTRIELLEPHGDRSPIARSLHQGVRLLHLCFEVPALDEALTAARRSGFHRISQPVPTAAIPGARVVWVHHPAYGLFELLEIG